MNATKHSSRVHVIASPGTYKAKTSIPTVQKDTLEDIQEQDSMEDLQKDLGGKAYPGEDS